MTTNTQQNTQQKQNTTLVIGGTGKTGRRVTERLAARGLPVRTVSRSSEIPFDWHDESTWEQALSGVAAAYLTYAPDLADPAAAPAIRAFARRAAGAGVRRLVLLSGRGEPETHPSEEAVRESGIAWTVLRCSWFQQNFSEDFLLEPVLSGELAFPAGDVPEPFIDLEDVADVAVAALTGDGHAGRVYELTGPRLLTFADAAAEISTASGRTVRYVPLTTEQFRAVLAEHLPPEHVELFAGLFARVLDGRNAHLTDDVKRVLGREPRDFAALARKAADAGVWAAAAG